MYTAPRVDTSLGTGLHLASVHPPTRVADYVIDTISSLHPAFGDWGGLQRRHPVSRSGTCSNSPRVPRTSLTHCNVRTSWQPPEWLSRPCCASANSQAQGYSTPHATHSASTFENCTHIQITIKVSKTVQALQRLFTLDPQPPSASLFNFRPDAARAGLSADTSCPATRSTFVTQAAVQPTLCVHRCRLDVPQAPLLPPRGGPLRFWPPGRLSTSSRRWGGGGLTAGRLMLSPTQ
jgi:hypothetical protein